MRLPHFTTRLHFRLSAAFLLLLSLSVGGYYLWINATVFSPYSTDAEEEWFQERSEEDLANLKLQVEDNLAEGGDTDRVLEAFTADLKAFGIEVVVFDPDGLPIHASDPDSLLDALAVVDPILLGDMATEEWDFSSYPDPNDAESYINRVFEVDSLLVPAPSAAGETDTRLAGYLVTSYGPLLIAVDELGGGTRMFGLPALVIMLIYTAVCALVILAWASRRIRNLSKGVATFAGGDFGHRVPGESADEIGVLGRNFNMMAGRIEEMLDALRGKEQFQRRLIANVSHDLRTPLASVRGHVETLGMKGAVARDPDTTPHLEIILGNLDHLERLVDHMLVLSKFDSGQTAMRPEVFSVVELADSVVQRCQAMADSRGIKISVDFPADLPLVEADPVQIAQVLQNLLDNALKFSEDGGRIRVEIVPEGDRVAVSVQDEGCGIPEEDLPHIFDRFFAGNPSRTREDAGVDRSGRDQSSGLGLAIASKITEAHHAKLEVWSRPGEGTRFRFDLPAAADDLEDDGTEGEAPRAESAES